MPRPRPASSAVAPKSSFQIPKADEPRLERPGLARLPRRKDLNRKTSDEKRSGRRLGTLQVAARAGIDLYPLALADEERDLDRSTGGHLGRLRYVARRIT